jgi:hypothetical protein
VEPSQRRSWRRARVRKAEPGRRRPLN